MKTQLISESTRMRAEEAKKYIEDKYNLNRHLEERREQDWRQFEERIRVLSLTIPEKEKLKQTVMRHEMDELRKRREKISKRCFEPVKIIGRGAFGEVRLCRQKKNNRMVAIKCLKKTEMINKKQQVHLKAERDILAKGGQWIVELLYSFQDQKYLYLVMDYLGGGDLMNLLIQRNVLQEEQARFYLAEIILAIENIHSSGYIHRDLKPDNVLIDQHGHIKLSDFGLCKKYEGSTLKDQPMQRSDEVNIGKGKGRRALAFSAVGTPDYIAPEMLSRQGYNELIDWWALGVMLYEMLIGYAPFSADSNDEIYHRIERHHEYLVFPPTAHLSYEVIDFISRLLLPANQRLGRKGAEQLKNHAWFASVDFNRLRDMKPPFEPNLTSPTDTQYFDEYEDLQPWIYEVEGEGKKDFNFVGYTYKETKDIGSFMKQELEKAVRQSECREKFESQYTKDRRMQSKENRIFNMKKNKFNNTVELRHGTHHHAPMHSIEFLETERGKSKSPLCLRDTNLLTSKLKKSTSKSPLKILKPKKCVVPINLTTVLLNSTVSKSKLKSARKIK